MNLDTIPRAVQDLMVSSPASLLRSDLASHPSILLEHQRTIAADPDSAARLVLARNPVLDPELQLRLVDVDDGPLQYMLSGNRSLSPEVQSVYVSRAGLAGDLPYNPCLVPEVQRLVYQQQETRPDLAVNPSLDPVIVDHMLLVGDLDVVTNLAANPSLTADHQERLLELAGRYHVAEVRQLLQNLAGNSSLEPSLVERLLGYWDEPTVMARLVTNPALPDKHAAALCGHEVDEVRETAARWVRDPALQGLLAAEEVTDVVTSLCRNPRLDPDVQRRLFGMWGTWPWLLENRTLLPELQREAVGYPDAIEHLASNGALVEDVQCQVLEVDDPAILGNLARGASTTPAVLRELLLRYPQHRSVSARVFEHLDLEWEPWMPAAAAFEYHPEYLVGLGISVGLDYPVLKVLQSEWHGSVDTLLDAVRLTSDEVLPLAGAPR